MFKKILIVMLLAVNTIFAAQAQRPQGGNMEDMPKEGILSGKIFDADLKKPVEYASIALYSRRDSSLVTGAVTNEAGSFTINELPYGMFFMEVKFIGYDKKTIENIRITPQAKVADIGQVDLRMASTELDEVSVNADKNYVDYKIDKKVINVSQHINAAGGTAVDVLENTPSIQTDIEGNVTLRGSSSFKVLIDGKPSVIDGNDLLQQLPASSIESIEIITNPSAKYDPDGTSGIINIIMKKQKKAGFNGVVNVSASTDPSYSGDILLNYRTGKFNIMAGVDYNKNTRPGTMKSERRTTFEDTTLYILTNGDRNGGRKGSKFKSGIDYYLTDKSTISISGEYGTFGFERSSETNFHEYELPGTYNSYYYKESESGVSRNFFTGNMYFQHKFDNSGHELSLSAYYSNSNGDDEENLIENITDQYWNIIQKDSYLQRSEEGQTGSNFRFQADYVKPLKNNGRFEAGYQARMERETEDYRFFSYDTDTKIWTKDELKSNEMSSLNDIHSAYTTFSNSLFGFEYQLGLRAEYNNRLITQISLNKEYPYNRFDLFPTVHVSRKFLYDQQLQASYSRRINRPNNRDLNPFPDYFDQKNMMIGNPALEPEFMDSYELNYQKRIKKSFVSLEFFYRKTTNKIERIVTIDPENPDVLIRTMENIAGDQSFGAELMTNLTLTKWWTMNVSASGFRYNISGELLNEEVNQTTNTWNTRVNSTFKFKTGTRLQLSCMYTAPSVTSQGSREAFVMANAAIRHDFFKNKLSATFTVRDPFKWMKHSFIAEGTDFYAYNQFAMKSPAFSIALSYKINNYKQDKKRNEGVEEMNFDDGGMK